MGAPGHRVAAKNPKVEIYEYVLARRNSPGSRATLHMLLELENEPPK